MDTVFRQCCGGSCSLLISHLGIINLCWNCHNNTAVHNYTYVFEKLPFRKFHIDQYLAKSIIRNTYGWSFTIQVIIMTTPLVSIIYIKQVSTVRNQYGTILRLCTLTMQPPLMLLTQMALPASQLLPSSVSGLRLRHTVKLKVPVASMSIGLVSPNFGKTIPYNGGNIKRYYSVQKNSFVWYTSGDLSYAYRPKNIYCFTGTSIHYEHIQFPQYCLLNHKIQIPLLKCILYLKPYTNLCSQHSAIQLRYSIKTVKNYWWLHYQR